MIFSVFSFADIVELGECLYFTIQPFILVLLLFYMFVCRRYARSHTHTTHKMLGGVLQ